MGILRRKRENSLLRGPARRTLLSKGPRKRRRKRRPSEAWGWIFGVLAFIGIAVYWYVVFGVMDPAHERHGPGVDGPRAAPDVVAVADVGAPRPEPIDIVQESILRTAQGMAGRGVRWEGGYVVMKYPGGDLPPHQGTSVDVLIRALRGANIDLQQLIYEDRQRHPDHYPLHRWRRKTADTSIDHRRLANVWAFFNRYAVRLDAGISQKSLDAWKPGDVVFWGEGSMAIPSHVGVVDDRRTPAGIPFVIDLHRDEGEISDQHLLTDRPIMGHFRVDVARLPDYGEAVDEP